MVLPKLIGRHSKEQESRLDERTHEHACSALFILHILKKYQKVCTRCRSEVIRNSKTPRAVVFWMPDLVFVHKNNFQPVSDSTVDESWHDAGVIKCKPCVD